jgi:hypothetical protein
MGHIADEVEAGVRRANDDGCGGVGCLVAAVVLSLGVGAAVGAIEGVLGLLGGPVGVGMVLGTLSIGGWMIYTGK